MTKDEDKVAAPVSAPVDVSDTVDRSAYPEVPEGEQMMSAEDAAKTNRNYDVDKDGKPIT